ncbi:MAG TPA: hypothetical protein VJQ57_05175 [Acidimicrobiia bacterium]|nr:hypothetical protein [Acidimicrobiia bacterium]
MPGRHWWATLSTLACSLAWAFVLVDEPRPWHRGSSFVLVASLLIASALAVVAILIESSRFGYRLGVATVVIEATIALLHQRTTLWYLGVMLIAVSSFLLADPRLGGWIRGRTSAAPIPTKAVILAMTLLGAPGVTALVTFGDDPGALPWLAGLSWLALLLYARRLPGALLAARGGPPLLALGTLWLPSPGRWLWLGLMVAATYVAASADVRLAVRPLIEAGSRLMIPPELAPEHIRRVLGKD